MNWKRKDANGLCVSIFLNNIRGKIHNYERIIFKFTGKIDNGTPSITNKTL